MGLHRILVELGISYSTPKDAEMYLAKYVSKKFQKAAAIYILKKFREGKDWKFVKCLRIVWRVGKGDRFKVSDPFLLRHFIELCGDRVRVTEQTRSDRANTLHQGGKFLWINIYTGHLEAAQTEDEFKKEFHLLVGSIYHECDHVFEEGSEGEDTYERTFLYLTQKGEIRAHSKEYAFHYHQAFPGVNFDFKKMKNLFEEAYGKKSTPANVMGYLEMWRDPEHFQTDIPTEREFIKNRILTPGGVITVEKCRKAYEAYIHFMEYFVDYFNKNIEHKIDDSFRMPH